jgi:hypothetical protein
MALVPEGKPAAVDGALALDRIIVVGDDGSAQNQLVARNRSFHRVARRHEKER